MDINDRRQKSPWNAGSGQRSNANSKASVRHITRPSVRALLGLTIILGALFVGPVASGSTHISPSKKLTLLQRGLNYYRGKTIVIHVGTTPGNGQDIQVRQLPPVLESYLHATVDVVDNGAGNGVASANMVASSTPNGLTIGLLKTASPLEDLATDTPLFNFNPEHVDFLAGYPAISGLGGAIVSLAGSPYSTFADLLNATAANPVPVLEVTGGISQTDTNLLLRTFGIHFRLITGYTSPTSALTGLLRGDGDVLLSPIDTAASAVIAGKLHVLASQEHATGAAKANPDASLVDSAPTWAQLVKKYAPKTKLAKLAFSIDQTFDQDSGNVYFAPTKTPTDEVVALQKALKLGITNPTVETQDITIYNNAVGYVSPSQQKASYIKAVSIVHKYAAFFNAP